MPRLAANLSMLFTEVDFLDRFAAAAAAGFKGVEFLFPYSWPMDQLAEKLQRHNLTQALFNMPPGDWDAGERGFGCLPDKRGAFQDGLGQAIKYAQALGCERLHAMAGIAPADVDRETLTQVYVDNIKYAARECGKAGITVVIEAINDRDMPGFFFEHLQAGNRYLGSGRRN